MRIAPVDANDEKAFEAWYAVLAASFADLRPGEPGWLVEEFRAQALQSSSAVRSVFLAAVDGERTVGAARLALPQQDNLRLVELDQFHVHPAHRRHGIGSALLAEVERLGRADGRDVVETSVDEPGAGGPGRRFALGQGFREVQTEVRRDLTVPPDPDRLAALEADCLPYTDGYVLRRWVGFCPDDLLEGRAELAARMAVDVPMGERDRGEEHWDGTRIREREQLQKAQDRTFVAVGAVHEASGELVGFTDVGIPNSAPERAYQWDTLVRAEHRGHRLGTWMKLDNLRQLAETSPRTRLVSTWNAAENGPMIAVNEALGCVTNGSQSVWSKHLG